MKSLIAVFLLLGSFNAFSQNDLGLGLAIGSPTGVHYFIDLKDDKRIEGEIGSDFADGNNISAHYVKSEKNRFTVGAAYDLDFNYGIGARVITKKHTEMGPSALLGVDHEVEGTQFSVLANSSASLLFGDGLSLDLNLYLGANYHF